MALIEILTVWLTHQGVAVTAAVTYARLIAAVLTILFAYLAYFVAKRFLLPAVAYSVSRTETTLDDVLAEKRVTRYLALLAPQLVLYFMAPTALFGYPNGIRLAQRTLLVLMVITGVLAIRGLLQGMLNRYHRLDVTREIPLTSFFQVISVMIYLMAGLLILGIFLDRSPLYLLSGFGAIMAILTIVFRDPLLGLMAGIQLTSNKLVARGDLIELPKYDASGEVLNVALTTVTIRNADQSITTVPTYALISESFKNWRGIEESGMRQIRRAILVDAQSIRFCSQEMVTQIAEIVGLAAVEESGPDAGNGRGLERFDALTEGASPTNLGLFRAYVVAYLRGLPQIRQDELLLVRQLEQTAKGMPLEIFAYSEVIEFSKFEALQASIFEHIMAKAADFDLMIYQDRPSG